MITFRIEVTDYDKETNTCKAILLNGDIVNFDPFVFCAFPMTDEEYENGKGFEVVGKKYLLTQFTVYTDQIAPHENGMIEI